MIIVLGAPQVYDNLIGNLHRHHVLVEKVPENHEHVNVKIMNQVNNKERKYPERNKNSVIIITCVKLKYSQGKHMMNFHGKKKKLDYLNSNNIFHILT